MKKLILLLLTLATSPIFAAVADSDLQSKVVLVNEYTSEYAKKLDPRLAKMAQTQYLDFIAQSTALQLAKLEISDFNVFMLYLTTRYAQNPGERTALFALIEALRSQFAQDLANTRLLREGPGHFLVKGATQYGFYTLLVGTVLWRGALSSPVLRNQILLQKLQSLEARAVTSSTPTRLLYRTGKFAALTGTSAAAGAAIGAAEYFAKSNATHRLDPAILLRVLQTELACELSLNSLDLQERATDLLKSNPDEALDEAQGKAILEELHSVHEEAGLLMKQFPRLDNIDTNDRDLQEDIGQLPALPNFQALREKLSRQEVPPQGQCYQISLTHLQIASERLSGAIELRMPIKPQEKKP